MTHTTTNATAVSSVRKEKMEKYRSRKFCFILYPNEDKTHKKALEFIKNNYDYALIEHNRDKNENGEIKKSHTHVVISLPNAKWNTALSDEIGLPNNYFEKCRSFDNALEYLIHFNDNTKEQYSIDEVQGTLKKKLKKLVLNDGKDENEKVIELIEFIDNINVELSETQFIRYACSLGYYDVIRRSSLWFIRILDRHNQELHGIIRGRE